MSTCTSGSASKGSKVVTCLTPVGWSAGAELPSAGERCRMECRLREGVRAMKGMWKTLAERLYGCLLGKGVVDSRSGKGGGKLTRSPQCRR
jgi:hypothetical protein